MNIRTATLAAIHEHLEGTYPEEGCGFLLGGHRGGHVVVTDFRPALNQRAGGGSASRRYLVTPEDVRLAEADAESAGRAVVGTYHSHPDVAAQPSDVDREHAWPWYRYLIVSVRRGRVAEQRAWELRDDRSGFVEHELIEES